MARYAYEDDPEGGSLPSAKVLLVGIVMLGALGFAGWRLRGGGASESQENLASKYAYLGPMVGLYEGRGGWVAELPADWEGVTSSEASARLCDALVRELKPDGVRTVQLMTVDGFPIRECGS